MSVEVKATVDANALQTALQNGIKFQAITDRNDQWYVFLDFCGIELKIDLFAMLGEIDYISGCEVEPYHDLMVVLKQTLDRLRESVGDPD